MIKIVFLDFDNTLYSHILQSIPKSAIDSLSSLQKQNIKVFLCTGRSLKELNNFNMSTFKYDGIIALNGQIIYDQNNNIISSKPIKGILKETIIDVFENKKLPMTIIHLDELYMNYHNEFVKNAFKSISTDCPPVKNFDYNKDFYMACIFTEDYEHEKILDDFRNISNVTRWSDNGIDIIEKGVSKASAIKEVLDLYGIKKEESIGFGDGQNDIEMMSATGISIAMGNAVDEVKEKATYVTDDITKDGIAKAIEKFIN